MTRINQQSTQHGRAIQNLRVAKTPSYSGNGCTVFAADWFVFHRRTKW